MASYNGFEHDPVSTPAFSQSNHIPCHPVLSRLTPPFYPILLSRPILSIFQDHHTPSSPIHFSFCSIAVPIQSLPLSFCSFFQPLDVVESAARLWNQSTAPKICIIIRLLSWRSIRPAEQYYRTSWTPNVHQSQKSTCVIPLSLHVSQTICPCICLAYLFVSRFVYISTFLKADFVRTPLSREARRLR